MVESVFPEKNSPVLDQMDEEQFKEAGIMLSNIVSTRNLEQCR